MCRRKSIVGMTKKMNNGLFATVVCDRGSSDIDVVFEDGFYHKHVQRFSFKQGSVAHSYYNPKKLDNKKVRMNNGMIATCLKDNGYNNLTIQFEDGVIKENVLRDCFKQGYVKHPYINVLSQPQTIVFNTIRKYFSDSVMDYRPDFLKNPYTGFNFELDIYIPSLRIGIEYDGCINHHMERSKRDIVKYTKIDNTIMINKLINIREKGTISHSQYNKVVDYSLDYDYTDKKNLYFQLGIVLTNILEKLGINKVIKINDDYIDEILKVA